MKTTLAAITLISGFAFCSASAAETQDPKVYLKAYPGTPFGSIVKILDALKTAGVKDVPAQITSTTEAKDSSVTLIVEKDTSISLILNKDTSMASVVTILDACKAAGLKTVSVSTTTTEAAAK